MVLIAGDLLAWMKGLCLEGALAKAEPKRLRYTLLHTAGILVRSARRTTLRIAEGWPWADELVAAFGRLPGWNSSSPDPTTLRPPRWAAGYLRPARLETFSHQSATPAPAPLAVRGPPPSRHPRPDVARKAPGGGKVWARADRESTSLAPKLNALVRRISVTALRDGDLELVVGPQPMVF